MYAKGNCGGQIPIDPATMSVNGKGELCVKQGGDVAFEYKNLNVTGDAVINHLDVTDSIVVPTPTDNNDAANKQYVDAHYITSPNGTKYQIKVADDGTLSAEAVV